MSKKMSQDDVSFDSELSTNQIGRIERGEINAGLSTIFELSKALKVNIKDLFDF
jgi:transcriptional regulator with XRE-family HTH domain